MQFSESLRKTTDFNNVYDYSRSFANRQLVMYIRPNNTNINRVGIVTSKKIGNSVVRHRVKRIIKESYRLNEEKFKRGYDIVFIARNDATKCNYFSIEKSIFHLKNKFEEI